MKQSLQIISWVAVVLGILAILGSAGQFAEGDPGAVYALFGGFLFLTQGFLSLAYISQQEK